jgi:hypothetical protein
VPGRATLRPALAVQDIALTWAPAAHVQSLGIAERRGIGGNPNRVRRAGDRFASAAPDVIANGAANLRRA